MSKSEIEYNLQATRTQLRQLPSVELIDYSPTAMGHHSLSQEEMLALWTHHSARSKAGTLGALRALVPKEWPPAPGVGGLHVCLVWGGEDFHEVQHALAAALLYYGDSTRLPVRVLDVTKRKP